MVLKMIIIVKDDSFMDIADIPNHYEREPKKIVVESQQDLLEAKKLKNIVGIYLRGMDEVEEIDLSEFKEIEEIAIHYNFRLKRINGLKNLSNLKNISYPAYEQDKMYNLLLKNILDQINLTKLLSQPFAQLLLSVFSIPLLKTKYPNFFEDFSDYSSKIYFCDVTDTFLKGEIFSSCTFEEAKQVELIIDKWIQENIEPTICNVEKFARIYEYVLNIDYDISHDESDEKHNIACTMAKTLLRGKGICVGYAQLLKYISLKCGLQCEYIQACLRGNYDTKYNETNNLMSICPKQKDKSKLNEFIIPNHAIVCFSPDNVNWLFADPTNDSFFNRKAMEENKTLKSWGAFCLTQDEMELYNVPYMYDYNGNEIKLNSQLTPVIAAQLNDAINGIFNKNTRGKHY